MARRALVCLFALALAVPLAAASLPAFPDDPLPGSAEVDPALVGKWLTPFDGQVPAISMVLLHDGRILYWGGVTADDHDQVFFFDAPHVADVAILAPPYDAASVTHLANPENMGDLFCAGLTILPDGRVLAAGGSVWKYLGEDNTGFVDGDAAAWTFDPATTSWTRVADMAVPRWYPTVMTTAEGDALAVSGIEHLPQPHTLHSMIERFDGAAWSDIGADQVLPMYPRVFTVPGGPMKGDLFYETVGTLWGPFGEHPLEPTWSVQRVLDKETNEWRWLGPSVYGARQHAATVMLPLEAEDGEYAARLLTFGGSIGRSVLATGLAEMTTLAADGSVLREPVAPLAHPRWHLNGVLLPDGSVLAVGGGMYDNVYLHGQRTPAVMVAERFDPATREWQQLAPMSVGRTYHSTALLLPDGRVLVGGHVPLPVPWRDVRDHAPYQSQIAETQFEIFEPPYLHWNVPRPVIDSAPASVAYGATFQVQTSDAARIADAILVHPGATTHAWDVTQRAVVLPVESRGDGVVSFVAPPDGDVAMPGPWMLFLRVQADDGLVPGVARFVTLG
ncbi:MAG TPA: galactose oxidase-like domain-containing protein [Candidatus Thermoplasmatota archaeon]|nr:galactose oxidase-like domain-containing protein [Candidatus Thermoplasmatota archaeon]